MLLSKFLAKLKESGVKVSPNIPTNKRVHIEVPCEAKQYSDQMFCDRCQLTWDVNDSEPPPCNLKG